MDRACPKTAFRPAQRSRVRGLGRCGRLNVPDFDGSVTATAGDRLAVGTDAHRSHGLAMAGQGLNQLAGLEVPNFDGFIFATTNKCPTISTDAKFGCRVA